MLLIYYILFIKEMLKLKNKIEKIKSKDSFELVSRGRLVKQIEVVAVGGKGKF
jgi:hypothetical protein